LTPKKANGWRRLLQSPDFNCDRRSRDLSSSPITQTLALGPVSVVGTLSRTGVHRVTEQPTRRRDDECPTSTNPYRRCTRMTPQIESARNRLQDILSELEQACSSGDNFSAQSLHEMHSLVRFLQENGFSVETIRQGTKLVVEVGPIVEEKEYEWAA
jgi:hypothetical protein